MKKIIPYDTIEKALIELDNGGRFYNLFTKENDGNITSSELSKATGGLKGKQSNVLFLEMNLANLDKNATSQILDTLHEDLLSVYKKYKPVYFSPKEALLNGKISQSAIVTGIPKYVKTNSDFNGFIFIPIQVGQVTTMTLVPIIDYYDVYELKDANISEKVLIAHARSKNKLPETRIRCGGIFKELKNTTNEKGNVTKFLDTIYYTSI